MSKETDRRGFIRATVAGVAGLTTLAIASNQALAQPTPTTPPGPKPTPAPTPTTTPTMKPSATSLKFAKGSPAYMKLSPAEQLKEDKRLQTETALREFGNYEIVWVKGKTPKFRRIVQMYG